MQKQARINLHSVVVLPLISRCFLGVFLTVAFSFFQPLFVSADWQADLENAFPDANIETFDNVSDWVPPCEGGPPGQDRAKSTDPAYFPAGLKFNQYTNHCSGTNPDGINEYKWIQEREPEYTWRGKDMAMSFANFYGNEALDSRLGPSSFSWYFGDGSANSGYSDVHLFLMYKPHHDLINLRTTGFTWHTSEHNNEYYLTKSDGTNPRLRMPNNLIINGVYVHNDLPFGHGADLNYYADHHSVNLGGLSENHWTYGDNDGLGFETIYVKLAGGADPQSQPDGYIRYENGFWTMDSPTTVPLSAGVVTKLIELESGFISDREWSGCPQACSGEPTHGRVCYAYGETMAIVNANFGAPQNSIPGLHWWPTLWSGAGGWNSDGNCWRDSVIDTCRINCARTWGTNNDGLVFMTDPYINRQWVGVEVRLKMSSADGAADGEMEIWNYSETGTEIGHWHTTGFVTKDEVGDMKYNRLRMGGNRLPMYYQSNAAAPSWENRYYIDDVIISGSQIGPAYFSLLNSTPDMLAPSAPTGLAVG